jgi:phosphoglycolate phosphatase
VDNNYALPGGADSFNWVLESDSMKNNILWDLDGTLTDPKEGILRSIQYALAKFDQPVPEMDDLLWCIGPPLYESFPQLVPTADQNGVLRLVELYRERFADVGLFENVVYPHIPDLLAAVAAKKKLFVATAKPHVFARRILEHFKLDHLFTHIYGSELNGVRSNKGDLIQYILETEGLKADETLIIGDRKHDVMGAKKAGIMSVGITWGYGGREELQSAGADHVFDHAEELHSFLLS